jgi:hypothetical protein
MSDEKPNCYKCIYRKEVPGSAHSSCGHPVVLNAGSDPMLSLLSILGPKRGVTQLTDGFVELGKNTLNIRGSEYGKRMGWFLWPLNYDPVWLENCDGFEEDTSK